MSELRTIARHALSVLAGQLAVMAFGVTDTIVAGRHSEAALAALSVGSAIYISIYVGLIGTLQALLPVWAEQRGAQDQAGIGRSVRQSLYVCALASVVGMAILLSPGPLLRWTDIPAELHDDVRHYLAVLALALPPALLFRVYSTLNQALGRPLLVTWLQVGSLAVKVPLSIWWTLGGAGLSGMGAVGCAWATLAVNLVMLLIALWLLKTQDLYTPLKLWHRMEPPHPPTLRKFARLGVPAGLAVMVEVTSFTLMALFIARQGMVAAGAHQIAANVAAVLYMVPLSWSIATSARVSYWLGRRQAEHARTIGWLGFKAALCSGALLASVAFLGSDAIARVYTTQVTVAAVASGLIVWVAAYHVADAMQTLCVFVLRCYHVTLAPLVVYSLMLWGAGLAGGYVLAYRGIGSWTPQASPDLFWAASTIALLVVAAAFTLLLWSVTRAGARHTNANGSAEK